MDAAQTERNQYLDAARLDQVVFWNPLPLPTDGSEIARRMVRDTDEDIKLKRLESALDYSLAVNALEPSYVAGFVRTCELLIATNRLQHAGKLIRSVESLQSLLGSNGDAVQLARLSAHVDRRTERTVSVARRVLNQETTRLVTPYVPAAINALSAENRSDEAIELARSWVEVAPENPVALGYLIREYLRIGAFQDAGQVLRTFRDEKDADRIWPENLAASALLAIAPQDGSANWRAVGPACQGLRAGSLSYQAVDALLEFLVPALPSPSPGLILAGLLALNANMLDDARTLLQTVSPESCIETYLVGVGLARIAKAENNQQTQMSSLRGAYGSLSDPATRELAESDEIFGEPATLVSIGIEIAELLRQNEAYSDALALLTQLKQAGVSDPKIGRLHAEIVGESGSQREALQELHQLLQQQEQARDYPAAVETLESMLRLNPGNLTLRNQLVDKLLRIGRFDEAIKHLVTQARLLHKAGRTQDAEQPAHRAIEIATMTGDWDTVHKLHRLMISFDPKDTNIRHSAVATYVQHGRTSEAIAQLRDIVSIARSKNDLDEAIAASHQLLALNPDDPDAYHQLGELLVSIGEYGQADRVYRRLAALVPDDPSINAKRTAIAAMAKNRK